MSDAVMVPREPTEAMSRAGANAPYPCDAVDVWKAMLAASPSVGGWEDISTAPKDGTVFLACNLDHPSFGSWPMYRRVRHYCDNDGQMQTEDRGGWGKISNLEPDYEDGHTTGPDLLPAIALDALNKSVRYGWKPLPKVEIDAAPPPVSTGSRPQEAVSTEQVAPTVVSGWDQEICTGCTASLSIADIKARGIASRGFDKTLRKRMDGKVEPR